MKLASFILALLVATTRCSSPTGGDDRGNAAWRLATSAPLAVYEAQGAVVGNRLYVFGGFYNARTQATLRVQRYDAAADSWDSVAPLPEKITHAGHDADDHRVWLVGGFVGDHPGSSTSHVWVYDVPGNRWSRLPDLPAPRGGGGAALVGTTLHFVGGVVRNGDVYEPDAADHWTFDVDTGTAWHADTPLPNPRNHLGVIALGGDIYAIGGQHQGNELDGNQSTVERYDTTTKQWTTLPPLPAPRGHVSSSIVVRDGRVLVIGGLTQQSRPLADVLEFDPGASTWTALDALPAPRQSPVAKLVDRTLITTTGSHDGPRATTWISTH
jgi:N-acetylneuraminic acid mutarotase